MILEISYFYAILCEEKIKGEVEYEKALQFQEDGSSCSFCSDDSICVIAGNYIQNVNSGLYLDVENGSSKDGSNIRQWTYNGAEAQKFKFVQAGGGYQKQALASSFMWAGYNDVDCKGGTAVWAPDVIYNPGYSRDLSRISN